MRLLTEFQEELLLFKTQVVQDEENVGYNKSAVDIRGEEQTYVIPEAYIVTVLQCFRNIQRQSKEWLPWLPWCVLLQ